MAWDARTHERVDVPESGMYFCDHCKAKRKLQQKMYCWICSKCRVVLINR